MARVAFAPSATVASDELLATREPPDDARQRVLARISQLEALPETGRLVASGPSAGARVLTGPWFISAHDYDESGGVVQVAAVLDDRTAAAGKVA